MNQNQHIDSTPVALVTGASRGIGKATAVWVARAGFDVALTARTVNPGEEREHSSTLRKSNTTPLPGSLTETAALVRGEGREALVVPADLADFESLHACVDQILGEWARVDVLVNNARYIGPGHMDRFLDTPIELLDLHLRANVTAQLVLTKRVLPGMIERGRGTIVNIGSAAGYGDPTKAAGDGGWGMGYGISKGAFQRIAGFLDVELRDAGVRAFTVQPGSIATERIGADMAEFGIANTGAPPDVVGAVVAWLATSDDADALRGTNIEAQFCCHERRLLPGWRGPHNNHNPIRYDESGAILRALEAALPD
jgi:NAD(P)-dependent dehydrogenase (short-subunit alcohol dehydrogenase family)